MAGKEHENKAIVPQGEVSKEVVWVMTLFPTYITYIVLSKFVIQDFFYLWI